MYRITSRPQHSGFRPRQLVVSQHAGEWFCITLRVGDIEILDHSVLGSFFTWNQPGPPSLTGCRPLRADEDVILDVSYVGNAPEGEPFFAALVGDVVSTEACGPRKRCLPLGTGPLPLTRGDDRASATAALIFADGPTYTVSREGVRAVLDDRMLKDKRLRVLTPPLLIGLRSHGDGDETAHPKITGVDERTGRFVLWIDGNRDLFDPCGLEIPDRWFAKHSRTMMTSRSPLR